ncbi:MAG: DUF2442 domain-containing protein [Actinomycetota bacterium]
MGQCARVISVAYKGGRRLEVTFADGLTRELDFHADWSGYLTPLNQDVFLAQVSVDPIAQTLCWPNNIDLDPDVLHGEHEPATGAYFTVISEFRTLTV